MSIEDLIAKAKNHVRKSFAGDLDGTREWLEAEPPHSYGDEQDRVRLWVLEGSPPKGYVLADYRTGAVVALDGGFSRKKVYRRHYDQRI